MPENMEKRYQERLDRYVTAMRNKKPDRVPLRPFTAEFTSKYAGYTCQQVTHDYQQAFEAVCKCAADFDWDAIVANMVYVWTGLTQTIGLRYYGTPGIDVPTDTGFQYLEPPQNEAFMRADEYDDLIADPTAFLFNTWLPRVSKDIVKPGEPSTFRSNMAFLNGGMAMWNYFLSLGSQTQRLRSEYGMPGAIAGILKAPLDILGDKLRGYVGLSMDLFEQPDKVRAACEALAPHLLSVALATADPEHNVPISMWMHRGCVPFISYEQFETLYWPTLKPVIEAIWASGHQVIFYAEGDWNAHLESFAELPEGSIIYHVDKADIFEAHKILGDRFCISGGIPNFLLTYGTPQEVEDRCKKVIDEVGADGGYVMDASAIIQNDAKVENVRAMTEFTREYGVYKGSTSEPAAEAEWKQNTAPETPPQVGRPVKRPPGVCVPWEEKLAELPGIQGDADLVKRIWEEVDALGFTFIMHCLVSF
ncbi:MAG: uroporphyrinogen decarboxylase family protein [Candidatus Hydrogenedentota bacterium]